MGILLVYFKKKIVPSFLKVNFCCNNIGARQFSIVSPFIFMLLVSFICMILKDKDIHFLCLFYHAFTLILSGIPLHGYSWDVN